MCKSLILIPCSKKKKTADTNNEFDEPLEGLINYRQKLLKIIADDNILSEKSENECGILNENATLTRAVDLYQGTLYSKVGRVPTNGRNPTPCVI
ncbi:MAG: hypothetical protein J7K40_08175 [candidate division Zixibacteria bacterium]|nr:hypothetical protein [candidate division Zixibacteria bacterium]